MLLLLLALGVQTVRGEMRREHYDIFPGKKFPMNETISLKSEPAWSIVECGALCLQIGCCVAANYDKDAGVCHMFRRHSTMEDSNHTVAIKIARNVTEDPGPLPWVGLWPLQIEYGGEDISGNDHHLELNDVEFPADDCVTPWRRSPAAYFPRKGSYGLTDLGPNFTLDSYSWMAKVYLETTRNYKYLMTLHNGTWVYSDIHYRTWRVYDNCRGTISHPKQMVMRTWHTLAFTYHSPTGTLTMWMDGTKHVSTGTPCGSKASRYLYIGARSPDLVYPLHNRMSCMGLFSDAMGYDVMYAATMQLCGRYWND